MESNVSLNPYDRKTSVSRKKKVRQSGLELLRIIAMIMIVASHLSQRGNWSWIGADASLSFNHFLMNVVICFGQVGVAIFFAITGYFTYNSKHYDWKRILSVTRPTWFYSLLFLFLAFIIGLPSAKFTWPLSDLMLHSLFPVLTGAYWFISAYVVLHLLLPYLKVWLDNLKLKDLIHLILIIALVFIIPSIVSYIFGDSSSSFFVFPAAIFYAIIGYTIHRFKDKLHIIKSIKLIAICCSGILIYAFSSLLIRFATTRLGYQNINNNILINTMSLPCMLTSIPLLIIFSRMKFVNKLINHIAGLVFGVYLIHSNGFFINYIWIENDLLKTALASSCSPIHFLLYFILTVAIIFFGCAILESIRKACVSLFRLFISNIIHKISFIYINKHVELVYNAIFAQYGS